MPQKSTKKRNSKSVRLQQKKKRERLVTLVSFAFMFVCVGAFASIGLLNSVGAQRNETQWYVENAQMEILAPALGSTLDSGNDSAGILSFMRPTATPEPRATLMSVPTPVPETEPSAEPSAEPAPTMDVLVPEPTVEAPAASIKITAVGDCTIGGDIPSRAYRSFEKYVENYGYDYFFANVRPIFEDDDLTIVNLEGPLTTSTDMRSGRAFNFRGKPEYVNILSGSSIEVCNVANNHAMDFGEAGLSETASVLENAGIGCSGFSRVYLTEIEGVKVCSIGFTEWAYTQDQISQMVAIAREQCDLLIVSIHWGEEKNYSATRTQQRLGRAIIDAGADVVLGTHTHVYGGFELYKGKYIVYSLGNFCFGGNRNPSDKNTLIFQQTFNVAEDGTVSDGGISIIPARLSSSDDHNDFQPKIATGSQAARILSGIGKESNVDVSQVVWLEDSYQVQTGMVALAQ